jgi:hypothetical protein
MTSTVGSKKRIVVPSARPGDVFDVQRAGEGRFVLLRLGRPEPPPMRPTRAQVVKAMRENPIRMKADWPALRKMTRDWDEDGDS